jgi:hypothetical protein
MFQRLMETAPGEPATPSTPASASPAPSPTPTTEKAGEELDYGQLTAEIEAHDAGEDYAPPSAPEPTAEPVKSTEEAAAVPVSPAAGESPQAPTSAPTSPRETPPAVVSSPEPAKAASPPAPAEAPAPAAEPIDFEKQRKDFLTKTEPLYKLSDEEAEEIRVSPHEALPKLASRLHFEVQLSTFGAVMQALPQLITRAFQEREAQQQSESVFYNRWPDLKKPEYSDTVLNSLRAYRAANPKASFDDIVEKSGLFAMISLGLNPVPAPQAPVVPTVSQTPPRPAGAGASPITPLSHGTPPGVDPMIAEMIEFEIRENM